MAPSKIKLKTQTKIQTQADGYGSLYHRIYSVQVHGTQAQLKSVMQNLKTDLNKYSPQELATFEKLVGSPSELKKSDKFQIHITGPWNGPVLVSEVSENAFRLLTLESHMEAGEIEFRLRHLYGDEFVFEIESCARSRDMIVDFMYDKLALAKAAQTKMWVELCQNFAKEVMGIGAKTDIENIKVEILTERRLEESGEWQSL